MNDDDKQPQLVTSQTLTIWGQVNRALIVISPEGRMTLGEGVTPDEAAREMIKLFNQYAQQLQGDRRQ